MSKINQLIKSWPKGTVKTVTELQKLGYSPQLLKSYSNSKWIELYSRGIYQLSGDKVLWQGLLFGMQKRKNTTLHAGAKTALTLKGFSQYIKLGKDKVYLFSNKDENFNVWLKRNNQITLNRTTIFNYKNKKYFTNYQLNQFEIIISAPELAIMEMLYLIPQKQSFDEALEIMEALTTLRPKIVQQLLAEGKSVKVKRLFLFMAEFSNHAWVKDIDVKKINLGSGKRVIVKNGVLDKKYKITIPKSYGR